MAGKPIRQDPRGIVFNWSALLAVLVLAASSLTAAVPAIAQSANFELLCVKVKDLPLLDRLFTTGSTPNEIAEGDCASDPKNPGGTLVGAGDVQIEVNSSALDKVLADHEKKAGSIVLFLNGVPLADDAKFIGGDKRPAVPAQPASGNSPAIPERPETSLLRFRIVQGQGSQVLWSMLYADGGMLKERQLNVGLGWRDKDTQLITALPLRATLATTKVVITTPMRLTMALVIILALVGLLVYMGKTSDLLRDAPLPQWWRDAVLLNKQIRTATKSHQGVAPYDPTSIFAAANYTYNIADKPAYAIAAEAALAGKLIASAEEKNAVMGLAEKTNRPPWSPIRSTFSLTQVQLALWFAFAVATGLFLWVLYGDLRKIDGSLLQLLGLSVGSAGLSWVADRNAGGRTYAPTQGFWLDLVTGFDDKMQVHRYQAVVVNLLLLVVGIVHVLQQLTYPTFEATWLIFLGVSSVAFGVGKQMKET